MTKNVDMETGEISDSAYDPEATENTNEAADYEVQATKVGLNLLQALTDELKLIKDPSNSARSLWNSLKQDDLDAIISRLTNRIQYEVRTGYCAILAGGVPSATAQLDKVVFSDKGIEGKLIIPRLTDHRHDLADFAGSQVVIVMADDISGYFENMADIVAPPDQLPLIAGDGDPDSVSDSDCVDPGQGENA